LDFKDFDLVAWVGGWGTVTSASIATLECKEIGWNKVPKIIRVYLYILNEIRISLLHFCSCSFHALVLVTSKC
jgi:hypothetical protein